MRKILLVEDNEMNRDMLSRRLERKGYEVLLAVDGLMGVEMARMGAPDLILMDMSLPFLDGWEAARLIKAEKATAHIPIIALTAHAMAGDRARALEAGCDDYDTKPVDLQRLLLKIEPLLNQTAAPKAEVRDLSTTQGAARYPLPRALVHDLRSPLNQIICYSEMLVEQADAENYPILLPDLERIRSAGHRVLSLFEDNFGSNPDPDKVSPVLPSPKSSQPSVANILGASKGSLLVVDDEEGNSHFLSRQLTAEGYAVAVAQNGSQALEMLRNDPYDLVLLDIIMPETDGYEVLRTIKADERLKRIPVVMVSALNELESVAHCIEIGADDYLVKPFNAILLKARISASVEKKRAIDSHLCLFDQLQENFKQLKELERLRDDLTHMIVHDLRTPLTSIMVALQTVEIVGDINEEQREIMGIATTGGETLLSMITGLLDVDKLESGAMRLDYAPISPPSLIAAAVGQVSALITEKGLTFVEEIAPDLPSFEGDEDKLQRTLVNLLGNAIKFTPSGGSVTLEARLHDDDQSIEFCVRDTGEGIPPEAFERIFEKFGQVENREGGRKRSTGLGLTFCKLAVNAHGGHIEVQSIPKVGSAFSFSIPIVRKSSDHQAS